MFLILLRTKGIWKVNTETTIRINSYLIIKKKINHLNQCLIFWVFSFPKACECSKLSPQANALKTGEAKDTNTWGIWPVVTFPSGQSAFIVQWCFMLPLQQDVFLSFRQKRVKNKVLKLQKTPQKGHWFASLSTSWIKFQKQVINLGSEEICVTSWGACCPQAQMSFCLSPCWHHSTLCAAATEHSYFQLPFWVLKHWL